MITASSSLWRLIHTRQSRKKLLFIVMYFLPLCRVGVFPLFPRGGEEDDDSAAKPPVLLRARRDVNVNFRLARALRPQPGAFCSLLFLLRRAQLKPHARGRSSVPFPGSCGGKRAVLAEDDRTAAGCAGGRHFPARGAGYRRRPRSGAAPVQTNSPTGRAGAGRHGPRGFIVLPLCAG